MFGKFKVDSIEPNLLLEKILDAVDKGIPTSEIRKDPIKYVLSGETKEIVVNVGGDGLKVSYKIISEMAKRGDILAQSLIEKDKFHVICKDGIYSTRLKDDYYYSNRDKQWTYLYKDKLEDDYGDDYFDIYDRENKTLIEVLKDGIRNIGGWVLSIYVVPVERWAYKITRLDDPWGSEYITGHIRNWKKKDDKILLEEKNDIKLDKLENEKEWKKGNMKVNIKKINSKVDTIEIKNSFSILSLE